MDTDHIKSAIDRAYTFCEEQQMALDDGRITEDQWFMNHKNYFTKSYLSSDNPRAQSGHGGDEARYRYTQEMILDAIHKNGSFIDVGCANGYLMEKLCEWLETTEYDLEFYGLDISAELIDLAKQRLPMWRDRFFVGNALYWKPPRKYDFVCVRELDYVPKARRKEFFFRLLDGYVVKGGRLILGPRTERRDMPGVQEEIASWSVEPSGLCSKPHQEYEQLIRRLYWFDHLGGPRPSALYSSGVCNHRLRVREKQK